MKRGFFVSIILIVMIGAMLTGMTIYYQKSLQAFESMHLAYAIDLSSDAAAFKMIDTDDINADYKDYSRLKVNPQVALDTFLNTLCLNYGLYPSEENRQSMIKYVPNFTVAGYDGYYMAQPSCVSDYTGKLEYTMIFTPKLPYTTDDASSYYALNMGNKDIIKLNKATPQNGFTRIDVKDTNFPVTLKSIDTRQAIINKILSDSIGKSINAANSTEAVWKNSFFLPSNLSSYMGVNPVSGPSILTLVQNVDLLTGKKASTFSITGAKITSNRPVVGYEVNDGTNIYKKYCYIDKLYNKNNTPLFPFMQYSSTSQRYYWVEWPDLKYMACSAGVDFNRLRTDPTYVLPKFDTTDFHNIVDVKIGNNYDSSAILIKEIFSSPKEAATNGYMYDNFGMRRKGD